MPSLHSAQQHVDGRGAYSLSFPSLGTKIQVQTASQEPVSLTHDTTQQQGRIASHDGKKHSPPTLSRFSFRLKAGESVAMVVIWLQEAKFAIRASKFAISLDSPQHANVPSGDPRWWLHEPST